MSEETNNVKSWLPWAVAISALVGIAVVIDFMDWYNIFHTPWTVAEGVSTQQAIDTYRELTAPAAISLVDQLKILVPILLFFVLGPACWILGEIRSQQKEVKSKSIIWYAGIIIMGAGLFSSTYVTTKRVISYNNATEHARAAAEADELRSDLRKAARKAIELYYVPPKQGGGGASFRAFISNGKKRAIQLTDITNHFQSQNTLMLKDVQSDSSITIYGISKLSGGDPDFKNADGQQGALQVAYSVNPDNGFYHVNKKESNTGY